MLHDNALFNKMSALFQLFQVSPPYDPFGTTALVAANLLFEMLCILPNVKYYKQ